MDRTKVEVFCPHCRSEALGIQFDRPVDANAISVYPRFDQTIENPPPA